MPTYCAGVLQAHPEVSIHFGCLATCPHHSGPRSVGSPAMTTLPLSPLFSAYCAASGSLEPDEDPLCMLLLIDHLALRARNYEYLIRLFQEWEVCVSHAQLCVCLPYLSHPHPMCLRDGSVMRW